MACKAAYHYSGAMLVCCHPDTLNVDQNTIIQGNLVCWRPDTLHVDQNTIIQGNLVCWRTDTLNLVCWRTDTLKGGGGVQAYNEIRVKGLGQDTSRLF